MSKTFRGVTIASAYLDGEVVICLDIEQDTELSEVEKTLTDIKNIGLEFFINE